jgi:thiamine biosynthesis lipoprotein
MIPDREEIEKALLNTDCTRVELNGDIVRIPDGMEIDLGGIAKGYITDQIAEYLRARG